MIFSCRVVGAITVWPRFDQTNSGKTPKLLLNGGHGEPRSALHLSQMKRLAVQTKKKAKYFRLHLRRKQIGQGIHLSGITRRLFGFTDHASPTPQSGASGNERINGLETKNCARQSS